MKTDYFTLGTDLGFEEAQGNVTDFHIQFPTLKDLREFERGRVFGHELAHATQE